MTGVWRKYYENSDITPYVKLLKVTSNLYMALLSVGSSEPLASWETLLTLRETEEGLAKTSPAARRNWLLGRLAAKAASGALLNVPVNEVEILRGPDGAPEARLPNRIGGGIFVSISHTVGGALAAVSDSHPVGVDLEGLAREFTDRAWLWAFTSEERELESGAGDRAYPRRLGMWCAKEAAAKSWGVALLDHFSEVRILKADWLEKRLLVERCGPKSALAEVKLMEVGNFILALAAGGSAGLNG